jgi:Sec-independent protein translocase protein TatA
MNKKGQEIGFRVIVSAILILIVLVTMIIFFSSNMPIIKESVNNLVSIGKNNLNEDNSANPKTIKNKFTIGELECEAG